MVRPVSLSTSASQIWTPNPGAVLVEVSELENVASKDEGSDVNPKLEHSPYPPNWPYGEKSKKTLEDVFGYKIGSGD